MKFLAHQWAAAHRLGTTGLGVRGWLCWFTELQGNNMRWTIRCNISTGALGNRKHNFFIWYIATHLAYFGTHGSVALLPHLCLLGTSGVCLTRQTISQLGFFFLTFVSCYETWRICRKWENFSTIIESPVGPQTRSGSEPGMHTHPTRGSQRPQEGAELRAGYKLVKKYIGAIYSESRQKKHTLIENPIKCQ